MPVEYRRSPKSNPVEVKRSESLHHPDRSKVEESTQTQGFFKLSPNGRGREDFDTAGQFQVPAHRDRW